MTTPSTSTHVTTGPAAAALGGTVLGLMALGLSQVYSERSEPFKHAMQSLGNLWMPGAAGIGPYSGKETVALLVWLLSWAVLHLVLRKREVNLIVAGIFTLVLVGVATTILWPPITHLLVK